MGAIERRDGIRPGRKARSRTCEGGGFARRGIFHLCVVGNQLAGQNSSAEASAPKGHHEGINVHGHWVINVLSPNGQLVSHTEFENSLQSSGMSVLALVLGGYDSLGSWQLSFAGTSGPCTVLSATKATGTCIIQPGTSKLTACGDLGCVSNILQPPNVPHNGTTMELTGALTFPSAGNVTQVETVVSYCPNGTSPLTCAASAPNSAVFTSANLPTAVNVAANQLVQITVTFSFS